MENKHHIYGLIGRDISHSFSPGYFSAKFEALNLDHSYQLFDIDDISQVYQIATSPDVYGLNVTIPYKESVIPHLDKLSVTAREIGAVNTIRKLRNGKLKGYNTDWFGFRKAITPLLQPHQQSALILGTGGAAKAVAYALRQIGIGYRFVSRHSSDDTITYDDLNANVFSKFHIVINCTPLGTYPKTDELPDIPYVYFTNDHLAFDLIYNPSMTEFLKRASERGAITSNGLAMLKWQAEKSWKIWNK